MKRGFDWAAYLRGFHAATPGLTERVLSRTLSGGHTPYRWLARAVSPRAGLVVDLELVDHLTHPPHAPHAPDETVDVVGENWPPQGHHAFDLAIFINHHGNFRAVFLQGLQQVHGANGFGYIQGRFGNGLDVDLLLLDLLFEQTAGIYNANNIVQPTLTDGKAGVGTVGNA